jgi:hypothetical protein
MEPPVPAQPGVTQDSIILRDPRRLLDEGSLDCALRVVAYFPLAHCTDLNESGLSGKWGRVGRPRSFGQIGQTLFQNVPLA